MATIVWFRQDLRTCDNPALAAAAARGPVVPVYISDQTAHSTNRELGGASKWWLHHSLASLRAELGGLNLFQGPALDILLDLIDRTKATAVFWNRCYDPFSIGRDSAIKTALREKGIETQSFNSALLREPWELVTRSGGPFKVFTPFWHSLLQRAVEAPGPGSRVTSITSNTSLTLERLDLLPARPNWAKGWEKQWTPGEPGARAVLAAFARTKLQNYDADRDRPDVDGTSRLSPYLRFGELSPRQVWAAVSCAQHETRRERATLKFLSELGWREFAYHLLYHFGDLAKSNWRRDFDAFTWRTSRPDLLAWQRGLTGYPLVDAGMRQLWQTGWMHNRVRMIAASFLTKHLRIDWREGENWFWDTLLDADHANNAAGWQWVAGTGADAAPYFRIFNPVIQGQKFDPNGDYVRRWCPELARLTNKCIHAPFNASATVLAEAGVELGRTYPFPIIDHDTGRRAALKAYQLVKAKRADSNEIRDAVS
jgi:deoxyribodipyrimidine photo-lyase